MPRRVGCERSRNIVFRIDCLALDRVIRQLHHIVEVTLRFVIANLQNVDEAIVQTRYWFVFQDRAELMLQRPTIVAVGRAIVA